ncbi:MAG: asparagine synthase C-terminal domain-containing protein [Gammaproteobacteria bacterium]|jgi:asparagine synthase (glutamine-hydrolysing)|nr:asparagine synthase C-terminal domain-containing protein [Gammaproteobacteria bacterium]
MANIADELRIRGICGWFGPAGADDEAVLRRMAAAMAPRREAAVASGPGFAFATTDRWPTGHADPAAVAFCGLPALGAAEGTPTRASLDRLAAAFARDGAACLGEVRNAFALAAFDPASGRGLLATDRIGQQPLYYARHGARLLFASSTAALLAHPGFAASIDAQAVLDYLYCHMVPSPDCIYHGVRKLPGAHCLTVDAAGPREAQPYWQPAFSDARLGSVREAHGDLLRVIRAAVGRHVGDDEPGAFLSGGLDSSTVAGVLAELRPGRARTFSIGFRTPEYDESAYAQIAARWFHTDALVHFLTAEEVLDAIPVIAANCDEPFGNSSILPAYFCARVARERGVDTLLGGDGGDEIYAGNERYAKQLVFERYLGLPAGLRAGVGAVVHGLPESVPLVGKARSFLRQAATPLPDRLQDYNYLHRFAPAEMLEAEFLAQVDLARPLQIQREVYRRPRNASALNRMLYLDWQLTLADNDLRKVGRACELGGVEVRYPLLDDAVVAQSLAVPSRQKLRPGRLRHFYKEAMRGFLPPEVLAKRKHGFGLPFGVWLAEHPGLRALAYDSLSTLKGRGYVRPEFIDRAVDMHMNHHAAYYGELVWVLMMLELWLAAR